MTYSLEVAVYNVARVEITETVGDIQQLVMVVSAVGIDYGKVGTHKSKSVRIRVVLDVFQ